MEGVLIFLLACLAIVVGVTLWHVLIVGGIGWGVRKAFSWLDGD